MNGRSMTVVLVFVVFLGSGVAAGPPQFVHSSEPPIVHIGQVLDAKTGTPLVGVRVIGSYDDWPKDAVKPGVFTTETDSAGVYYVGGDRPVQILSVIAGYDSLVLHWPEEFEGSDRGGCDINLAPVKLVRTKR